MNGRFFHNLKKFMGVKKYFIVYAVDKFSAGYWLVKGSPIF